ncbi:MAG TPA: DUF3806 domain-containing protein [Candidatus Polarisedimenticolia bacterium]|jgi:hypothetical protein|nr:DUF3806 domain-containing protein [Candidatus Polarisedimenticolia bacterium]
MKQKIDPISEGEQAWIATQLVNASGFVAAFSAQDAEATISLTALDRAFAAWMGSGTTDDAESTNKIINSVGVAFGRFLVEGLGLRWVIATDEHGSDLAVYGLPGTGDILLYPTNFIAKRWESQETNFIEESYRQIERQVRSIERQFRQ